MGKLDGKVAIITGAGGGIGQAAVASIESPITPAASEPWPNSRIHLTST